MEYIKNTNSDIIEVFVKLKFGLKLTDKDVKMYNEIDPDIKETINSLLSNYMFINDIDDTIHNIVTSQEYSDEENARVLNSWDEEKKLIKKINKS